MTSQNLLIRTIKGIIKKMSTPLSAAISSTVIVVGTWILEDSLVQYLFRTMNRLRSNKAKQEAGAMTVTHVK